MKKKTPRSRLQGAFGGLVGPPTRTEGRGPAGLRRRRR